MKVSKSEILFGRLAVKLGMATKERVHEGLREQAQMREKGKDYRLGQVMIMKGFLTIEQVQLLLKHQHKTILQCPKCTTQFNIEGYLPGMEITCRKCGKAAIEEPWGLETTEVAREEHSSTAVGHTMGGYELVKEISRGGMGIVYKAKRKDFTRTVALKMLLSEKRSSKDEVKRFRHEARAIAKLCHPNIVAVYDLGESDGQYYFVMEFVEGESLEDLLAKKRPSVRESLRIVRVIAEALHYAHGRGIYHRDIKPGNILIEKGTGRLVLTDFGLAVKQEQTRRLTRSGFAMGTPAYMAPEQCQAQPSTSAFDARTDIYQLGIVLYEMFTGMPPFDVPSPIEILLKKINEDVPPPRTANPEIPAETEQIVMRCLQREKSARYQSGEELARDIEQYLAPRRQEQQGEKEEAPAPTGSRLRALSVIVILGLLTVTVYCAYAIYLAVFVK